MNALAVVVPSAGGPPQGPEAYCFGDLRVLAGVDLLYRAEEVVPLEPRAVQVLRHLVRHAGRVVTKEELLDQVWPDTFVTDGVLKKAISQIRRALDDPPQRSRFIETYHRRGYRFVAPVQSGAGPRPAPPVPVEEEPGLGCLDRQEAQGLSGQEVRQTLAGLAPDLRELLEAAAVVGEEFRVCTLARVTGRAVAEIEPLLGRALRAAALSGARLSPGEDCRFRHPLVRQVLYDDLAPWRRRALHQRAAEALEEVYADELDRVTAALSAHWRVVGDLRRAFRCGLRAAEAALRRWQWQDALACAERAREDLTELQKMGAEPPAPAERIALRTALGQSLSALGRTREAEAALEAAAEEAGDAGDPGVLATVFFHLAQARVAQGRQAEARAASERALELFNQEGDGRGRAQAVVQLAGIRIAMGEYAAAADSVDRELERLQIQPAHTARFAAVSGWAHALQGSFAEAVRLLGIAVADRRTSDDPRGLAAVLGRLQWAHLGRGEHRRALELAAEAQACFRAAGDRLGEARMEMARGQILTARGLAVQAVEPLRRSARALGEAGDVHCEAEALWLLGQALTDLGRLGEARPLLTLALARVREVPDRDDELRVLIDLARLWRREGRPAEALEAARRAREIADDLGSRAGAGQALAEMAGAHRALGQPREALAHAEAAVAVLDCCGAGEVWRALHELGLAQEPWQPALAALTLERCGRHLAATRDDLDEADRPAFEEVRRQPLADLHRLLQATEAAGRAAELRSRWTVALKSDETEVTEQ